MQQEGLLDRVKRDGVVVIPGVLGDVDCQRMREGCWDMISHLTSRMPTPFDHSNPDTWSTYYNLMPLHSMMLQYWGVGHAQWVWDVRTNPAVVAKFAELWNVPESGLLVSFDGVSYAPPHETTERGAYKGKIWYHTDQSFRRSDFECAQGFVTANQVRKGDATLTYLRGSHLFHQEFAEQFPESKEKPDDWYKLSPEQLKWYEETKGCQRTDVTCPAGSLVLWDSRTIHAGKEAIKDREQPNERVIVYVCYTPRREALPKTIAKRIKAFEELRMTTHWPHKCKLFGKTPQLYGKPVPNYEPLPAPVLDDMGRSLVGYDKQMTKKQKKL